MIKQIYSLITFDEAVKTMEAGATCIGLVPMQNGGVPAHRVPLITVDKIFTEARERGVACSAIMLTNNEEEMVALTKRVRPDILHISGDSFVATPHFVERIKKIDPNIKVMQAVLVDGPEAKTRAQYFASFVDQLILDTGLASDTGIGASGATHDWSIDAEIVRTVNIPVIVAGGLGPDNVEEAIRTIRPAGVDSLTKTSVMLGGGRMYKDIDKVKKFCDIADQTAKELGL